MTDLVFAPANKIIFTISPSNVFRIEPEIGYRGGKNKNSDLKYSSLYFGFGAFGMFQRNKLNIHYGVRVEYAILKWEDNISTGFGSSQVEYTDNRILAGPALGCEYYLGENFAFGGELALKYGLLKSTIDPKPTGYKDGESTYFTTDTGLFIRFYFGK